MRCCNNLIYRTDAKVTSSQRIRNKNPSLRRINKGRYEPLPGVGEVQERFNPRPYFDYVPDSPSKPKDNDNLSYSYDKPFDSFPNFNPSTKDGNENEKPPNTYGSPYTSYNPPPDDGGEDKKQPENVKDMQEFRPTSNYDQTMEYETPPPSYDNQEVKPPQDKEVEESVPKYPNDFMEQSDDFGPEIIKTGKPPVSVDMSYLDHPTKNYNGNKPHFIKDDFENVDDDIDLNPPPKPSFPKYPAFYAGHDVPYDFGDHHHVYHEIKTTTTTAAPEDERVNKGHYSYYYLGRKLWYIPLYFSVYFIVYITVLILKSIARHKVSFVQHFDDKRTGRNYDIDEIGKDVNRAIEIATEKYMM